MVLSADPEQDPNSLAIAGTAAALAISEIPFPYVLGGVRVSMKDGKYIANATYTEGRESKLNIVVAGTEEGIVMVEAGAQEVSEAEVLGAIEFGHECCKKIAAGIRELMKLAGKKKREFTPYVLDGAVYDQVEKDGRVDLTDAMNTAKYEKLESYAQIAAVKKRVVEALPEEKREEGAKCFSALKERVFRDEMVKNHRRPDGRAFDEVRKITIETGVLPRTHGSALFTRGETQALVTVTLGTKDDARRIADFSRRRYCHGVGTGRQRLRHSDRHCRRRGPLRRHGLQSRRNALRHHRPPDGYQGAEHHRGYHEGSFGAGAQGPPPHSGQDVRGAARRQDGDQPVRTANLHAAHSDRQDSRRHRTRRQSHSQHHRTDGRQDRRRRRWHDSRGQRR